MFNAAARNSKVWKLRKDHGRNIVGKKVYITVEIEISRHIEYLHAFDTFGLHLYSNTICLYVHYLEKEILLILGLAGPGWRGLAFLIVGNLCFFGCPCERDVG